MKVLAIGAHPDDIEFGCGALIQKYTQKDFVVLTKGERGGENREEESIESALLAQATLSQYSLEDTAIDLRQAIEIIERHIDQGPDVILTMGETDLHQDHSVTHQATKIAARGYKGLLLSYMSPSSINVFRPNIFYGFGESQLLNKLKLLKCHRSQKSRRYLQTDYIVSTAEYWAMISSSDEPYIEPFELIRNYL